jgi:hypothetical protein
MFTSTKTKIIFLTSAHFKKVIDDQIAEENTSIQNSSKCPNQLRLHQEDHRRKEEYDQDHQFFDQIYKPEDTTS